MDGFGGDWVLFGEKGGVGDYPKISSRKDTSEAELLRNGL